MSNAPKDERRWTIEAWRLDYLGDSGGPGERVTVVPLSRLEEVEAKLAQVVAATEYPTKIVAATEYPTKNAAAPVQAPGEQGTHLPGERYAYVPDAPKDERHDSPVSSWKAREGYVTLGDGYSKFPAVERHPLSRTWWRCGKCTATREHQTSHTNALGVGWCPGGDWSRVLEVEHE